MNLGPCPNRQWFSFSSGGREKGMPRGVYITYSPFLSVLCQCSALLHSAFVTPSGVPTPSCTAFWLFSHNGWALACGLGAYGSLCLGSLTSDSRQVSLLYPLSVFHASCLAAPSPAPHLTLHPATPHNLPLVPSFPLCSISDRRNHYVFTIEYVVCFSLLEGSSKGQWSTVPGVQ